MRPASIVLVLLLAGLCGGCAARAPRPAPSSLECMRLASGQVPVAADDAQKHCLATAFIARYCSPSEAVLAGAGKELRDLFGPGDAAWADLRADRRGLACARGSGNDQAIRNCCAGTPD